MGYSVFSTNCDSVINSIGCARDKKQRHTHRLSHTHTHTLLASERAALVNATVRLYSWQERPSPPLGVTGALAGAGETGRDSKAQSFEQKD